MTLLLACDITIDASVREPAARAGSLAVAVAASESTSAALSANSNVDMMVVLSSTPTATPGFWRPCIRKIRSSPAINATDEKTLGLTSVFYKFMMAWVALCLKCLFISHNLEFAAATTLLALIPKLNCRSNVTTKVLLLPHFHMGLNPQQLILL